MQVKLLKDVNQLGTRGMVKNVAKGYFLNYLGRFGFAKVATQQEVKEHEEAEAKRLEAQREFEKKAQNMLETVSNLSLSIEAKVNKKGGLFAAIGRKEIAELANKELDGLKLDEKYIDLKAKIKKSGEHKVKIKFTPKVKTEITLTVKEISE